MKASRPTRQSYVKRGEKTKTRIREGTGVRLTYNDERDRREQVDDRHAAVYDETEAGRDGEPHRHDTEQAEPRLGAHAVGVRRRDDGKGDDDGEGDDEERDGRLDGLSQLGGARLVRVASETQSGERHIAEQLHERRLPARRYLVLRDERVDDAPRRRLLDVAVAHGDAAERAVDGDASAVGGDVHGVGERQREVKERLRRALAGRLGAHVVVLSRKPVIADREAAHGRVERAHAAPVPAAPHVALVDGGRDDDHCARLTAAVPDRGVVVVRILVEQRQHVRPLDLRRRVRRRVERLEVGLLGDEGEGGRHDEGDRERDEEEAQRVVGHVDAEVVEYTRQVALHAVVLHSADELQPT